MTVSKNHPDFRGHERRIKLDGSANFRDLGGYPATDQKRVKWRKIFRSGHLASLSESDLAKLSDLGIKTVCDFRSKEEINRQPNKLPRKTDIQSLHLPIVNTIIEPTQAVARIMKGDASWFTPDFMTTTYIEKLEKFPDVWNRFFNYLDRESSRPLLFHCTAGKDRTGVCAALLLLSLGVPEDWVIYDHGLSNIYNAEQIKIIQAQLQKVLPNPDILMDYLTAPKNAMEAVIEHLNKHYGSAQQYLVQKANLTLDCLERLEKDLLEKP